MKPTLDPAAEFNPYAKRKPNSSTSTKPIVEGDPLEDEIEAASEALSEDKLNRSGATVKCPECGCVFEPEPQAIHEYDESGEPHDAEGEFAEMAEEGLEDEGEEGVPAEEVEAEEEAPKKKRPKSFFNLMGYGAGAKR